MKYQSYLFGLLAAAVCVASKPVPAAKYAFFDEPIEDAGVARHLRPVYEKRAAPTQGQPEDSEGRGAPFSGPTNPMLDAQNPENLGYEVTDNGVVPNLKWSFSDSKMRLLNGGWVREQVITDLPSSTDISAAQQHLKKGASRELHWHRVAEWGYLYAGELLVSAVDENGANQLTKIGVGDIWYFPKGSPHTLQGLADQNEYLLVFDEANFDASGTTFMLDDWLAHTPKDVVAKNFGVDESTFENLPTTDPYIVPPFPASTDTETSPYGTLSGAKSFIYPLSQKSIPEVPGGGGTLAIIDSTVFPIATTLAAAVVTVKPGAMRELHWHPNAQEWLFFLEGTAKATVFMGEATARSYNFRAGDTAAFPDNSGHYIENTSKTKSLKWIEMYKDDRVQEIPLSQWLAVSPHDIVAKTLNVSTSFVDKLSKTKQIIIK